jgi:hypothetical protein
LAGPVGVHHPEIGVGLRLALEEDPHLAVGKGWGPRRVLVLHGVPRELRHDPGGLREQVDLDIAVAIALEEHLRPIG